MNKSRPRRNESNFKNIIVNKGLKIESYYQTRVVTWSTEASTVKLVWALWAMG